MAPSRTQQAAESALTPLNPDPVALRLRAIHRAASEQRRGTPVLLEGDAPLVALAAETAGARGLSDLAALAAAPPVLLLSPVRAAAILRRPVASYDASSGTLLGSPDAPTVAFRTAGLLDPALLRGLADPTADQLLAEPLHLTAAPSGAEAALVLAKLARLLSAMLVAPARPDAAARAVQFDLLRVPGEDVLRHPAAESAALAHVAEAHVPLADAPDARVAAFRAPDGGIEHLAIVVGRPENLPDGQVPLVRVHSECFTGDLLGSLRCDCGAQLRTALARMAAEGAGVLVYLAQEGRGIGLVNKLRAYALQDRGLDTLDANRALGWDADERRFLAAAAILEAVGVRRVRLLTNNPDKVAGLAACGIEVVAREPLVIPPNGVDDRYLATKAQRLGHLL